MPYRAKALPRTVARTTALETPPRVQFPFDPPRHQQRPLSEIVTELFCRRTRALIKQMNEGKRPCSPDAA